MTDFCDECGERVDPAATFCPACLASIGPVVPTPQSAPTVSAPPPNSSLPWIMAGAATALLLAGIGYRLTEKNGPAPTAPPDTQAVSPLKPAEPIMPAEQAVPVPKPATPAPPVAKGPAASPQPVAKSCTVADPTNSPLNLRSSPNGGILAQLPNGRQVDIIQTTRDGKGRSWALIITYDGAQRQRGWVYREFVSCLD
ncbi:MAG: hypothetical protein RL367_2613 [Pseudomonadota bacterium]